jgi:hypothetical protein
VMRSRRALRSSVVNFHSNGGGDLLVMQLEGH